MNNPFNTKLYIYFISTGRDDIYEMLRLMRELLDQKKDIYIFKVLKFIWINNNVYCKFVTILQLAREEKYKGLLGYATNKSLTL